MNVEDKDGISILVLGLLPYLMHRESVGKKMLCENCGLVFTPRKARNWKAELILLLVFLVFAFIAYCLHLDNPAIFN